MDIIFLTTNNIMNEHSFHPEGIYGEKVGGGGKLQRHHRIQFYRK